MTYGTDIYDWVPTRQFRKFYWQGALYIWLFKECYIMCTPEDTEPLEIIIDENK